MWILRVKAGPGPGMSEKREFGDGLNSLLKV